MAKSVEVIGLKEANAALKRLPEFAKSGAQQVIDVTAFQVYNIAASKVPVRTGLLKASLAWETRPRSVSAVMGTNNPAAYYWKYLEYGTERMSARPFLRPAAEIMRPDHERRMLQALEKAADQVEREAAW